MSKYDPLAKSCFGKPYGELDLDDQIFITDLYNERKD
jgi:hypothetical protein